MRPLPASHWKARAESKERRHENSSYERHMQKLAVARQIRSELREERKQRKLAS